MKRGIFATLTSRVVMVCMLAMMLPVFNSCNKESADAGDLLSTVPSSAGLVVGVNVKSVLEKSGCKVDGSDITPGQEVSAWIDRQKDVKDSARRALKLFLDGESGIDPTAAIYFTDAYNSYLTAGIADTGKFESFIVDQTGMNLEDAENGVRTCGNIAIKDAQVWICVSSNNTIDAKAVANYATLGANQSFMQNGFSPNIATMTSDIVGWGDIKAIAKQGLPIGDFSTMNLVAGMLFENASAISFNLDFDKGKCGGSLTVMNLDGEPAKYLLPSSKIDLTTVKSVGANAQFVAAMTITKDFTKKIEKIGSSLGGNMFGSFIDALKPIDGTVAVACGDLKNPESSLCGVVTTDGEASRDFMSMLSGFGETKKDGKLVRVTKGTVSGPLDVAKAADMLKGSIFGVVMNMQNAEVGAGSVLKTMAFRLVPSGKGLKCDITLESVDDSKNMLLALIEQDAK